MPSGTTKKNSRSASAGKQKSSSGSNRAGTADKRRKSANGSRNSKKKKDAAGRLSGMESLSLGMEIFLFVWLGVCLLLFLCNLNIGRGSVTGALSNCLFALFGWLAYLFPVVLFFVVFFVVAMENRKQMAGKVIALLLLFLSAAVLFQVLADLFFPSMRSTMESTFQEGIVRYFFFAYEFHQGGGLLGAFVLYSLSPSLGMAGVVIPTVILFFICVVILTKRSIWKALYRSGQKAVRTAQVRREKNLERREEKARWKEADRKLKEEEERLKRSLENAQRQRQMSMREKKIQTMVPDVENSTILQNLRHVTGVTTDTNLKEPSVRTVTAATAEKADVPLTGMKDTKKRNDAASREAWKKEMLSGAGTGLQDGLDQIPRVRRERPDPVRGKEAVHTQAAKEDAPAKNHLPDKNVSGSDAADTIFHLPPLELLQKGQGSVLGDSDDMLRTTALKLQKTLESFGVKVTVTDVSCGPAVTRYELQPEVGVKVSRIVNLQDDLKLNLAVTDIRIEAPIPGKPAVGIEVPNSRKTAVYLRELLESPELKKNKSVLAFPAGKDVAGKVIVADLARMPHMLVAGTTGSGKSVFTNSIIMSMLYRAKPSEVRFIIIDPKVVEFGVYNGIPHLMIPVVTDPKKAAGALNWATAEMSDRYKKFAEMGVRDLKGYNEKVEARNSHPKEGEPLLEKLPKIVIIIDELADLMMVAAKEVEDAICRLAQLARAAGIHMIIATQRPSVDVVTGLIKANIPSRVALSVASGIDSRTILDMNGAEKLLGNGDMLFYPSGYPKPVRLQGAFVSDQEVFHVVEYLKTQGQGDGYSKDIQEQINRAAASAGQPSPQGGGENDRDEYFEQAGRFIIEKEKASIGMLQRVLKIGFNRAARIMDQLAKEGVVGEEEGTKPRKVLMTIPEFEALLEQMGSDGSDTE